MKNKLKLLLALMLFGIGVQAQVGVAAADTSLRATVAGQVQIWKSQKYYQTAFGLYYNKVQIDGLFAGTNLQSVLTRGATATINPVIGDGLNTRGFGLVNGSLFQGNTNQTFLSFNSSGGNNYIDNVSGGYIQRRVGGSTVNQFYADGRISGTAASASTDFTTLGQVDAKIAAIPPSGVITVNGRNGNVTGLAEQSSLQTEIDRATAAEALKATTTALTTETNARIAADALKANQTDLTSEASARSTADATLQTNINNSITYNLTASSVAGQNFVVISGLAGKFPISVFKGTKYAISTTASDLNKTVMFNQTTGQITFPENMVAGEVISVDYKGSGSPADVPVSIVTNTDIYPSLVSYPIDFSDKLLTGGSGVTYVNRVPTTSSGILDSYRVKAPVGSVITPYVYSVTGTNGSLVRTLLHTYTSVTVNSQITSIRNIDDGFIIEAGMYVGYKSSKGVFYVLGTGGQNSLDVSQSSYSNNILAFDFVINQSTNINSIGAKVRNIESTYTKSGGSLKTLNEVDENSSKLIKDLSFLFSTVALSGVSGGGVTKTGDTYTGLILGGFNNFAISNRNISAGYPYFITSIYRSGSNDSAIIGLKETPVAERYTSNNYKVGFYFFSGQINIIDNGVITNNLFALITNAYYRIKINGSGVTRKYVLQSSIDNITYTDLYTYSYTSDTLLYLVLNINGTNSIEVNGLTIDPVTNKASQSDITLLQSIANVSGTDAVLTSSNPILSKGQLAIVDAEDGTFRLKAGDGISTYSALTFNVYTPTIINRLGVLYNKSSWADLTDFTLKGGVSATVVGDKIQVSGGVGTFTQFLGINRYTNLPYWKMTTVVKILENGSTAYGFGAGHYVTNSFNSGGNTVIGLGRYEAANAGGSPSGRAIVNFNRTNSASAVNSSVRIPNTVNGLITLITERDNMVLKVSVVSSDGTAIASYTYGYGQSAAPLPTTGLLGVFSLGGLFEIESIKVQSTAYSDSDILFVGDSKTQLYSATSDATLWTSVVARNYPNKLSLNLGGGYDRTDDILLRMPEILATMKQGTIVVLNIGSNDKRTGISQSTWWANYQNIVNQLTAAGGDVRHLLQLAENSLTFSDYNALITGAYPSNKIINVVLTTPTDLGADGVHPIDSGQAKIATGVINNLGVL